MITADVSRRPVIHQLRCRCAWLDHDLIAWCGVCLVGIQLELPFD